LGPLLSTLQTKDETTMYMLGSHWQRTEMIKAACACIVDRMCMGEEGRGRGVEALVGWRRFGVTAAGPMVMGSSRANGVWMRMAANLSTRTLFHSGLALSK
jgi:hypothetical protein